MDENNIIVALEAESQEMMVVKAIMFEVIQTKEICQNGQETTSESRMLNYIYDDEPLGFEKELLTSTKKMQAQDHLEEVDLGGGMTKRPTYISAKIDISLKTQVIKLLKEFKYFFNWDYGEIPKLSRDLVE